MKKSVVLSGVLCLLMSMISFGKLKSSILCWVKFFLKIN